MSFILPPSWSDSGKLLSDWTTVIGSTSVPCYMEEVASDVSPSDMRISSGTTSAAEMEFFIPYEIYKNEDDLTVLHESILGGYCHDDLKHRPMKHPKKQLWATDILSLQPCGLNSDNDNESPGVPYNVCKIVVAFQTLSFPVNGVFETEAFSQNWISVQVRGTNQRSSTPLGWYEIKAGTYTHFPTFLGQWHTQPQSFLSIIIHQVEHSKLFTFNWRLKHINNFGKVNDSTICGWLEGQLLLDSAMCRPYYDVNGHRLYDVQLDFIANAWGWNVSLDPAADLQPIGGVLSDLPPFDSADFNDMMNDLNQVAT